MTDHGPQPALVAEHIDLRLGASAILHGVSLHVPQGAVLGLVGRNGAGKSSLLRCLVGLTAPQRGRCSVLGEPSLDLPDTVRARLGYVAQTPDLIDWLTADEHFERIGALYPRWDTRRALALAVLFDLPLRTPAQKLSLGDQQKLSVVLALGHDPDVLVLDELVASLDPLTRRDFMRALFDRREADAPRTVLLSSHLLSDLERVVSHVAFLRQGRMQLVGTWDGLAERMRLVDLPAGSLPDAPGVIHRSTHGDRQRLLVDSTVWQGPFDAARTLNLDALFEALHA